LLRTYRIDAACGMLRTTSSSLAEVAAACGFCDQAYFTHVFREQKKTTPRQYRESMSAGMSNSSNAEPGARGK